MSAYDSGGSSQMVVNGVKKVFTGRAIANGLCYVSDDNSSIPTNNIPSTAIDTKGTITVSKIGLNVRDELKFYNGKATGKVIGFIKVGQSIDIIDMVEGLKSDGYQWAKVLYNGQIGYCQYDSQCYWLSLKK